MSPIFSTPTDNQTRGDMLAIRTRPAPLKTTGLLVFAALAALHTVPCVRIVACAVLINGLLCHTCDQPRFVEWDVACNAGFIVLVNATTGYQPQTAILSLVAAGGFLLSTGRIGTQWDATHVALVQLPLAWCLASWSL